MNYHLGNVKEQVEKDVNEDDLREIHKKIEKLEHKIRMFIQPNRKTIFSQQSFYSDFREILKRMLDILKNI